MQLLLTFDGKYWIKAYWALPYHIRYFKIKHYLLCSYIYIMFWVAWEPLWRHNTVHSGRFLKFLLILHRWLIVNKQSFVILFKSTIFNNITQAAFWANQYKVAEVKSFSIYQFFIALNFTQNIECSWLLSPCIFLHV